MRPPGEVGELEELELGRRGRIAGKSYVERKMGVPIEEVEERRLRGVKMLMEELENMDRQQEVDDQTAKFIRMMTRDVEDLATQLIEVEEEDREVRERESIEAAEEQNLFLQTRMYSIPDVKKNIEEWIPSMKSELHSLTEETGAVRIITTQEAEELRKEADRKDPLLKDSGQSHLLEEGG